MSDTGGFFEGGEKDSAAVIFGMNLENFPLQDQPLCQLLL